MTDPTNGPPPDDDFSAMLKRVRVASGDTSQDLPKDRAPKTSKAKSKGFSWTLLIAPAAIIGFVLLVLYGFASIATWSATRFVTQAATGNRNANTLRRLRQLERLAGYGVAVDTTITPLEAGRLFHAISRAGDEGDLNKWEQPIEGRLAGFDLRSLPRLNPSKVFETKQDWSAKAFFIAKHGFNAEQRAFLTSMAKNPTTATFRRLAHARAADVSGGYWEVPADTVIGWPELPLMRGTQLRYAAFSNVTAAALDLEAGRVALAEQRLREVISVGFVLERGARSGLDESMASALIGSGRSSLEALYRSIGRTAEADQISVNADPPIPLTPYNPDRLPVSQLRDVLRRRILDTTELASARWELLLGSFAHLPCTAKSAWFFGPSAAHLADLKAFHDALVRYPSDERRFAMPVRSSMQLLDPPSGLRAGPPRAPSDIVRTIGRWTGNGQFQKCAALLTWQQQ